jgi:hypothetical protein
MIKSRISIIAAIDEKRGLGKDNDLLFKIPDDMKRLRLLTKGHPLVMGRRTFESLGRLLPNRSHIVITRDPERLAHLSYQPDVVVSSLTEGIAIGRQKESERLSSLRANAKQSMNCRVAALLAMTAQLVESFAIRLRLAV